MPVIINLNWETFRARFMRMNICFVKETGVSWEFYASQENFIVKSIKPKSDDGQENLLFVEQNLNMNPNLVLIEDVSEYYMRNEEDGGE